MVWHDHIMIYANALVDLIDAFHVFRRNLAVFRQRYRRSIYSSPGLLRFQLK